MDYPLKQEKTSQMKDKAKSSTLHILGKKPTPQGALSTKPATDPSHSFWSIFLPPKEGFPSEQSTQSCIATP